MKNSCQYFFSFGPKLYVYEKIIEIILQFAFEESVYICKDWSLSIPQVLDRNVGRKRNLHCLFWIIQKIGFSNE